MSKAASCNIKIDLSGIESRFSPEQLKAKQEAFASRVAFEMRDYVPRDEGTLQDSEALASDYAAGRIEWTRRTPSTSTTSRRRASERPRTRTRAPTGPRRPRRSA